MLIINLGRIKQNNKNQVLLKGGLQPPLANPPLDPPLRCRRQARENARKQS